MFICWFSFGGWFRGMTRGFSKNVELRIAQHRIAADPEASLSIARAMIHGKISNQRTLLRRNGGPEVAEAVEEMRRLRELVSRCGSAESLLGLEGAAARTYFAHFPRMLKASAEDGTASFDFRTRNRRPPRDPVNALLSYAYALLAKDLSLAVEVIGFDPFLGFFHRPRYGRPALALDLAEEFRPIIADSVVISAINNGEVRPSDFIIRAEGCSLTSDGRKRFIGAYERRMDTLVQHPRFDYSLGYRRVLEVQARLLARHVLGELPSYRAFRTR